MRKRIAAALALTAGLAAMTATQALGGATARPGPRTRSRAAAAAVTPIGPAQAQQIALSRAAAAGDPEPVVEVESDSGSEAAAAMASPQGAALGAAAGSDYVVDMRGSFTLGDAHLPRGAAAPRGTVLKVLISSEGFVLGVHLGMS